MILRLTVVACLIASVGAARADFDDYKPSTLKQVFATDSEGCRAVVEKQFVIDVLRQVFTAPAVWRGDVRPIPEKTARIIQGYGTSTRQTMNMQEIFKNEVRVTDDGVDYWLAIQEPILAAFKSEVGPGGKAMLYVAFLGCHHEGPVVTINEFHAAPQ